MNDFQLILSAFTWPVAVSDSSSGYSILCDEECVDLNHCVLSGRLADWLISSVQSIDRLNIFMVCFRVLADLLPLQNVSDIWTVFRESSDQSTLSVLPTKYCQKLKQNASLKSSNKIQLPSYAAPTVLNILPYEISHPTPSHPWNHHFKLIFFCSPTDCVCVCACVWERKRERGRKREREN